MSKCLGKPRKWMPETIQIGGRTYSVKWYSEAEAQAERAMGHHSFDGGWIRFDETLDDELLATVALHEISHAIYRQFTHSSDEEAKVEEDFVERFSGGLAAAIHQNTELFKKLIEKLR